MDAPEGEKPSPPAPGAGPPVSLEEVRILVIRAQSGDRTAAPRLRTLFDRDPGPLMRLGAGDLAESARALLIDRAVGGDDILAREAKRRRIDQVRDELAGPDPTAIERLLAERAAFCWAEVHFADARVLDPRGDGLNSPRTAHLDRYRDRAQRRYLAALKALATVRRLAVPVLQVNVANQQVNQIHPGGGGA